jgi:hypothetical protein
MQVEIDSLEQVLEVENAITAALEDFELVVEAFPAASVLSLNEKVSDFLPPASRQV